MKTTKDDRAHWKLLFDGFDTGSAPEFTHHLIADVDDAVKWLQQQHEALAPNKKLPHSLCGVCDFLKEPGG